MFLLSPWPSFFVISYLSTLAIALWLFVTILSQQRVDEAIVCSVCGSLLDKQAWSWETSDEEKRVVAKQSKLYLTDETIEFTTGNLKSKKSWILGRRGQESIQSHDWEKMLENNMAVPPLVATKESFLDLLVAEKVWKLQGGSTNRFYQCWGETSLPATQGPVKK